VRLYEYEGKALLAGFGIPIPRGALWPHLPETTGPWAVKAQVLTGQRGRHGGIRFASSPESCRRAAADLGASTIGGYPVQRVYVEEWLDVARELYVSIVADGERRAPLLLAAARGGTDVEELPSDELLQVPIDVRTGLHADQARDILGEMRVPAELSAAATATLERLYSTFRSADAELVEINPLALTRDGRLVALDAKVVLDDRAAFRHPEWPTRGGGGTAFEERCAALGAVGVEMEGAIAAIVSGAGLMMATIDLLVAGGGRVRAAVDLGGAAFLDSARLEEIVGVTFGLHPRAVLVNAFFQLASCAPLARGLAAAYANQRFGGSVIARLKGRGDGEAQEILEPMGIPVVSDLADACRLAVAAGGDAADGDSR